MKAQEPSPDRPRRLRRWLKRLAVSALVAAVVLTGVGWYVLDPQRLAGWIEQGLAEQTGAQARVDWAAISLPLRLEIGGLDLRLPEGSPEADRLLTIKKLVLEPNLQAALAGRLELRQVAVTAPVLYVTENLDKERYNYQMLRIGGDDRDADATALRYIPQISLEGGQIRFGSVEGGDYRLLEVLDVRGNLTAEGKAGRYAFVLEPRIEEKPQPEIRGAIDLEVPRVEATGAGLALSGPQKNFLPEAVRQWWERLEPAGSVSQVAMGYEPEGGAFAQIELDDVAITLPYEEISSRMTHVSGRLRVSEKQVLIERLSGRIEGLDYTITGRVGGLDADAPFELGIKADRLQIDREARYLPAMPRMVHKLFERYQPEGTLRADVKLVRDESGGPVRYDGSIFLEGLSATYWKFKYPLSDVRGEMRLSEEKVELIDVRAAGPTGAQITINGTIAPPRDGAQVDLVIDCPDGAPVDEALLSAMKPRHRELVERFFDQEHYQKLIDAELIQSARLKADRQARLIEIEAELSQATEAQAQQLEQERKHLRRLAALPSFDMGGLVRGKVHVHRPLGRDVKYQTTLELDPAGAGLVFEAWPYPVRLTGGALRIEGKAAHVQRVAVEGISGAVGMVDGVFSTEPTEAGSQPPVLQVVAGSVPTDALLLASIPSPQDKWIRELSLDARLTANGRVWRSEDDTLFEVEIQIPDGRMQPSAGPIVIDQLRGRVTLNRRGATIHKLRGQHGEARFQASGELGWQDDQPSMRFDLGAQDLTIHRDLLGLVPERAPRREQLVALFKEIDPAGLVDATLNLTRTAEQRSFEMRIAPRTLAFNRKGQRVELREMEGSASVWPDRVRFDELSGRFGHKLDPGRFSLGGYWSFGQRQSLDLNIDVQSPGVGALPLAFAPRPVREVVEQLSLQGGWRLHDAELIWQPQQDGGRRMAFNGVMDLTKASAKLGAELTDIDGKLRISALQEQDWQRPHLDLRLDLDQLAVEKRAVAPMQLHLASSDDRQRLEVRHLRGAVAEGVLLGEGHVDLRNNAYQVQLVLEDAALGPILHPEKLHLPKAQALPGVVQATLHLAGTASDPATRRGRGELQIHSASLYHFPAAMAMLQLVNMTLPTSSAFDQVLGSFLIDGHELRFDRLSFEAPNVAIVGGGSIFLDSRKLDLLMVCDNPEALDLGPLSEMLEKLRDELVAIRVTGTIDNPRPRTSSFRGLRSAWEKIFGSPRNANQTRGEANTPGQ